MPEKKPAIIEPTTASFVANRQNRAATTGANVAEFRMVQARIFHQAACSVRSEPKMIISPVKISKEIFVYFISCRGEADGYRALPTSFPKLVAPENWQGAPQPNAHAQMPRKNKPTNGAGNTCIKYCGNATNPSVDPGTTAAADSPNRIPNRINGMPKTAANFNPFCPSSGVRQDNAIWKAACARMTF